MKCSALNVDCNGVRLDPLGSRSPPYERIKFGYPLENVRFLLLSTNLARAWLQIDTDLLHIITSTADGLSSGTNIHDLERPWTPKIGVLSDVLLFLAATHTYSEFSLKYTGDRVRQPAYEIRPMLWRVSWALAQISCCPCDPIKYYTWYINIIEHVSVCFKHDHHHHHRVQKWVETMQA